MSRPPLSRRAVLTWGAGGAGALVASAWPSVAGAATRVTLWRLDADWGTPVTDVRGRQRSRCSGRACHHAAPNRYFLTQADAVAGRLHPGCLAQPVPVEVVVDLNALMPYHRARHGGVDLRCPELPDDLRLALRSPRPSTTTGSDPTTSSTTAPPGTSGDAVVPTSSGTDDQVGADGRTSGSPGRGGAAGSRPGALAFTGSAVAPTVALAVGAVAAGVALTRRRVEPSDAEGARAGRASRPDEHA